MNSSPEEANRSTGEQQLTVEQAYRLKDEINKSITYGPGLNAREVVELKKVSGEQWAKVRREYDDWAKGLQVLNNAVLLIVAIAGFYACVRYVRTSGWIGWAALVAGVIALCAAATLFKRDSHREGYLEGYEAGFSAGIDKAYDIDEKEAQDIHDRAIDMRIDEGVINAFDKKTQERQP